MAKNIEDMSFGELKEEITRVRNLESRMDEIAEMLGVLKDFNSDHIKKIIEQFDSINESRNTNRFMNLNFGKEPSKTQKMKNAVLEILSNGVFGTSQLFNILAEKGIVMPMNTNQGKLDYNNLRNCLAVLKNEEQIYRDGEERGTPWKIRRR